MAESTFLSAKVNWNEISDPLHGEWLDWYRRILRQRHERIVPLLARIGHDAGTYQVLGSAAVCVRWDLDGGGCLQLALNLCDKPASGFAELPAGESLWNEGPDPQRGTLGPWSVRWSLL